MRVAADIGGTFTDLIFSVEQVAVWSIKVPTTPPNFEQGIVQAIQQSHILLNEVSFFVHGSTVIVNAITERKGVKTALVTTQGFRDVLEIARANRPDLFNFNYSKPKPFVPRHNRYELHGRIDYQGYILEELQLAEVEELIVELRKEEIESVAICFLHAYKNPVQEKRVAALLLQELPNLTVVCSHTVSREWREYERSNTAVLSAYVKPFVKQYLQQLSAQLSDHGLKEPLYLMKSNGGIDRVSQIIEQPISMVESGPAAGVLGAQRLGELIDEPNIIVLDIGGTTAKCSLIVEGKLQVSSQYHMERSAKSAGYPLQTPVVEIVEIGNGGGSITWLDAAGKIHVGPQSAGAVPGPAAYGLGGEALTTTDAQLLLGRIQEDYFLQGTRSPDWKAVQRAAQALAEPLQISVPELARGVVRIAEANMVNALKLVSVNKGYDPRDFTLLAMGGGGGMHAAFLAEELQFKKVIIPIHADVFAALGMLLCDMRRDAIRTNLLLLDSKGAAQLKFSLHDMVRELSNDLAKEGFSSELLRFDWFLDMRYTNQEHVVKIPIPQGDFSKEHIEIIEGLFHQGHLRQFTYELAQPVEVVNIHITAYVETAKTSLIPLGDAPDSHQLEATKLVDFDQHGKLETPIYLRESLALEISLSGPALIVEGTSSTVVPPGFEVKRDSLGNLLMYRI